MELRLKDRSGAYRVFYLTRRADNVLVFHAFTNRTPKDFTARHRARAKEAEGEEL